MERQLLLTGEIYELELFIYLFLLPILAWTGARRNFNTLRDLLKMSRYQQKAYRKENTTSEWDDDGKIGNKNK